MSHTGMLSALTQSAAGEWIAILSLVFGGCCSNVFALEAVLKGYPSSGTFLTFAQFVYVAVQTIWSQFYFLPNSYLPRWRRNVVPMSRWMVQVILFFLVSIMNNYAFALKIPVTVHIIFRSGGLCVSMLVGYFAGAKRYSFGQALAGFVITVGIVLATVSAPRPPRTSPATTKVEDGVAAAADEDLFHESMQYAMGIGLLAMALVLSAWLGLWQEATYKQYGKQWREALFYCHVLSLPFFIPMASGIATTWNAYLASAPVTLMSIPTPDVGFWPSSLGGANTTPKPQLNLGSAHDNYPKRDFLWRELAVPGALLALIVNVVTQGVCIRGVNRLTTRVSSTTVNLILTLRKAVSLAISVWFYGSGASWGLFIGGALVLGGTVLYSFAPPPHMAYKKDDGDEKEARKKPNGGGPSGEGGEKVPPSREASGSSTAVDVVVDRPSLRVDASSHAGAVNAKSKGAASALAAPTSPTSPTSPTDPHRSSSLSSPEGEPIYLPGPKEVYGLIGVLLSYLGFALYLVWAFFPSSWLDAAGWTWYPAREWAVIVPCWLMVVVLLSYFAYAALSVYLTPGFDSPTIITDQYSNIPDNLEDENGERYYWKYADVKTPPEAVDLPIDLVNRVLYPPRPRPGSNAAKKASGKATAEEPAGAPEVAPKSSPVATECSSVAPTSSTLRQRRQ